MGSADGGSKGPGVGSPMVDVVDEDLLKSLGAINTMTPILRIGQPSDVPVAFVNGFPSKFEGISQRLCIRSISEVGALVVRLVVVVCGRPSHESLSGNNKEVSKRHLVFNLSVDGRHSGLGNAFWEAGVVWILKIQAAIGAARVLLAASEVQEIVSRQSHEAANKLLPRVVVGPD